MNGHRVRAAAVAGLMLSALVAVPAGAATARRI